MVTKSSILKNLKRIKNLYDQSVEPENSLFYSKLAIIELCGWIEESMDDIALKFAKRKLKQSNNLNYVEKEIIKNVHSFHYENNFRLMLMRIIGIISVEKIEKNIDAVKFQIFKAAINKLKPVRDQIAHTHIQGTTLTIDAPSVTLQTLIDIYKGLKSLEKEMKNL